MVAPRVLPHTHVLPPNFCCLETSIAGCFQDRATFQVIVRCLVWIGSLTVSRLRRLAAVGLTFLPARQSPAVGEGQPERERRSVG